MVLRDGGSPKITPLPYPATHEEAEDLKRTYAHRSKIEKMYQAYGQNPSERCGDCRALIAKNFSRTYYKCVHYSVTSGPSTDWSKRWIACGKFERRPGA